MGKLNFLVSILILMTESVAVAKYDVKDGSGGCYLHSSGTNYAYYCPDGSNSTCWKKPNINNKCHVDAICGSIVGGIGKNCLKIKPFTGVRVGVVSPVLLEPWMDTLPGNCVIRPSVTMQDIWERYCPINQGADCGQSPLICYVLEVCDDDLGNECIRVADPTGEIRLEPLIQE